MAAAATNIINTSGTTTNSVGISGMKADYDYAALFESYRSKLKVYYTETLINNAELNKYKEGKTQFERIFNGSYDECLLFLASEVMPSSNKLIDALNQLSSNMPDTDKIHINKCQAYVELLCKIVGEAQKSK